MAFKNDVPNYENLKSKYYYTFEAPANIWRPLEAFAVRAGEKNGLRGIVDLLNDKVLFPPTANYGQSWLTSDINDAIREMRKRVSEGDFSLLMDTIQSIVEYGSLDLEEINCFLEKEKVGYILVRSEDYKDYWWEIRPDIDNIAKRIVKTKDIVRNEFQQAYEHFEQAKKQLSETDNERAWKDAVRDCASAMEAIIKFLGEKNEIGNASKSLRQEKKWGEETIVKDGDSIFNTLHRLYPDLRHGNHEKSYISFNEAVYWVDRISVYVDYMIRQKKIIGK